MKKAQATSLYPDAHAKRIFLNFSALGTTAANPQGAREQTWGARGERGARKGWGWGGGEGGATGGRHPHEVAESPLHKGTLGCQSLKVFCGKPGLQPVAAGPPPPACSVRLRWVASRRGVTLAAKPPPTVKVQLKRPLHLIHRLFLGWAPPLPSTLCHC